jgi:4-deoxy-L-threo-5-hexosulose-uronate ketol-isomerase
MMLKEMPCPSDPGTFGRMTTVEMRAVFLLEQLFRPDRIELRATHADRAAVGTAVPGTEALILPAFKEFGTEYFTERRELGVINLGGTGTVCAGKHVFRMAALDAAYIGRGTRDLAFSSEDPARPAQFYFVSYPAHATHPCTLIDRTRRQSAGFGSPEKANQRVIHKLIYPGGAVSCQLVMGFTELAPASVWNTMPPHTHRRRSEIYLYYDLAPDEVVLHCMGEPGATRHIVVRDRQAVVSPEWSTHFGVGTSRYSFVWTMGGENQEFTDMDAVPMASLR